ncbi:hypothetical protein [Microbacterium sp. GbtcB4]|uniref:hypothetical protein n=1 Tax=Microbacterium sp. GbtcB4 TaxID=2824749 RepID=UPI001C311199
MSGSKAKARRQAARSRPLYIVNGGYAARSAKAMLALDLREVALTRVTQFIVGWFRAAFDQSLLIADLTMQGRASAAAPNRRLFAELAVRLHWLNDLPKAERPGAVDAALDWERKNQEKTFEHMRQMGWESEVDLTEMREFVLNVTSNGEVRNQAEKFAAAAHATEVKNAGLYRAWREESSYAHATGFLAGSYAPAEHNRWLGSDRPPVADPDLETHRLTQLFIVAMTYSLLRDEGIDEEVAEKVIGAYMGV